MTASRRLLGIGLAIGLLAGALLGAGAVLARASALAGGGTSAQRPDATLVPAPETAPPVTVGAGGAVASGGMATGSAIAYPVFAGSPGLAPDHTIVVTGTWQAALPADATNRAGAQKTALAAAIADAKAQALAIAAATGVTLKGVLSVSASVSPYWPVVPLAGGAAPGQAPTQPVPVPMPPEPVSQSLIVSVTVAYTIG